jgi:predicted nucleic acid-binding protein
MSGRPVYVDTNVLIALVDRRDALHARASKDLVRLASSELRVTSAVLSESVFALPRRDQRGRLSLLVERLPILPAAVEDEEAARRAIFAWLERHSDHQPDYADAELCVLASGRARVWTYDAEFKTVWRRPDGRRVALAPA